MQKSDVDIRSLQIGFGGLKVLENLDLHVGESEFLVLLGPSGCGKSTLLNAIAGLIEAKVARSISAAATSHGRNRRTVALRWSSRATRSIRA
jgi:ABC-type Fe3+/spermidine/putrescine transport system ATPase subunit